MLCFYNDRDAMRFQIIPDTARYFRGEPFLHLQAPRKTVEHARKL